jgi:hypothetical protein
MTEAAHGFANAHGELRDGSQALDGVLRKSIAPDQQ